MTMFNKKESTEDYLENIYLAKQDFPILRLTDLAKFMGFSKPSVSIALKKLKSKRLINIEDTSGSITLTKKGEDLAKKTYERHSVLTNLFKGLGVNQDIAEQDACKIEHLLSEETFAAIKKHQGKNKH